MRYVFFLFYSKITPAAKDLTRSPGTGRLLLLLLLQGFISGHRSHIPQNPRWPCVRSCLTRPRCVHDLASPTNAAEGGLIIPCQALLSGNLSRRGVVPRLGLLYMVQEMASLPLWLHWRPTVAMMLWRLCKDLHNVNVLQSTWISNAGSRLLSSRSGVLCLIFNNAILCAPCTWKIYDIASAKPTRPSRSVAGRRMSVSAS